MRVSGNKGRCQIQVQRALRVVGASALILVLAVSMPSHAFAANSPNTGPSLTQLITYVKASSQLNQGPDVQTSLPTLINAANDGTSAIIPNECVNDSNTPTPLPATIASTCAFGDKTASEDRLSLR